MDKSTAYYAAFFLSGNDIYNDILRNNIDLETSFNTELMVENTIADPNSALLTRDYFIKDCKVYHMQYFITVIKKIIITIC